MSYKTIFSGSAGPFSVVLRPCVVELVTLRFFAKRLFRVTCSVEAFDIFHQLSSTQYIINAQGRTETWNRTLPNYVMLHMSYHFSRKPKR